jgi:hypothetical protein
MQQGDSVSHEGEACLPAPYCQTDSQQIVYGSIAVTAMLTVVMLIRALTLLVKACKQ